MSPEPSNRILRFSAPSRLGSSRLTNRGLRWGVVALASGIAVVGLAACSSGNSNAPSSSASTITASSTGSPTSNTASVTPSSTASSTALATVGALAQGFPTQTLPVFAGAEVKQSSFDKSKAPATASLVITTSKSPESVLDFYTKTFTDAGFTQLPGDAVGTVKTRDFVRSDGTEKVNIGITTEGSVTTVTLGVIVTPDKLK